MLLSTSSYSLDDDPVEKKFYLPTKYNNEEVLIEFLEQEDSYKYLNQFDGRGLTALHLAAIHGSYECLKILLEQRADPNKNEKAQGKTPLHFAVEKEDSRIVKTLLDYGGDPNAKDNTGVTPLDIAEEADMTELVFILHDQQGARKRELEALKATFSDAVLCNDIEGASTIAEQIPDIADTIHSYLGGVPSLLYRSCEAGNINMARLLLGYKGVDLRLADPQKRWLPIHVACQTKSEEMKNLVVLLIEKAPKTIATPTSEGHLPLHIAAELGIPDIVEAILNYEYDESVMFTFTDKDSYRFSFPFDLNKPDQAGKTPLYSACCGGLRATVEMMLNFKVSATRFQRACEYDNDLEQCETEMPHNRSFYQNVQDICPFDANCCDKSPIQDIIRKHSKASQENKKNYLAIAEMMLKQGIDPNMEIVEDEASKSPLMLAFLLCDLAMMDILLKYGACDVDQQVLKNAAFNEHNGMISILLKYCTFQDTRNKINQARMRQEGEMGDDVHSTDSFFRSKFPTKAVSINWQGMIGNMEKMQETWWMDACLHHNEHLRLRKDFVHFSITQIDVSNNSLKELPPEIFQLQSLRFLNACKNCIEVLPERLNNYPEVLEELQIQRNEIQYLPVWLFHRNVAKLARLNASSNKINELPKEIWSAPKLTELSLVNNKISELPLLSFKSCNGANHAGANLLSFGSRDTSYERPKLKMQFSSEGEDMVDMVSLREATMVQNCTESQFKSYSIWVDKVPNLQDSLEMPVGDEEFVESRLKELNLANNCFKVIPRNLPCIVPKLAKLNLSGNQIMEIGHPKDYPKSLKVLILSGNTITGLTKNSDIDAEVEYLCHTQVHSSGKSRTASRKKHHSTFSGMARRDSNNLNFPTCFHRQHQRFDSLHSLYLGNNMLIELNLTFKKRKESDASNPDSSLESLKEPLLLVPGGVPGSRPKSANLPSQSSQSISSDNKRHSSGPFPQSTIDDRKEKKRSLLFPFLSTLDVSNNKLRNIPDEIAEMEHLTQLILKKNDIRTLPSALGNLNKLWNFDLSGCPLEGRLLALRTKNASASDILGYLKSQQDKMVEYNRLKLMVVGVENIGKSMMLRNLRKYEKNPSVEQKTRSQRLGHPDPQVQKQKYLPTEGVDIQHLTMNRNKQNVIFRTWDFGGKREYYATHQYFLSKRALYLVVWNMEHGETGIKGLHQWLVNIQARVPDSNVIIVGTHLDHMKGSTYPKDYVTDLCAKIEDKFIKISESSTHGLPKVLEHIEISNTKRFGNNIDKLAELIFKVATGLDDSSTKHPFVKQKIPYRYLALEDVVTKLAQEKRQKGEAPILTSKHYKYELMGKMSEIKETFNSENELDQAIQFLHENGVLLHYDDCSLQHLYFLEPQWLCDMLTCVLENEDPSIPINGQIRIGDLKHRFRNSPYKHKEVEQYIIDLMNKFELGLQYDDENLIIPQLLPTEKQLREKQLNIKEVWIPLKKPKVSPNQRKGKSTGDLNLSPASTFAAAEDVHLDFTQRLFTTMPALECGCRDSTASTMSNDSGSSVTERNSLSRDNPKPAPALGKEQRMSTFYVPTPERTPQTSPSLPRISTVPKTLHPGSVSVEIKPETEVMKSLRRLYLMSYFPSGFWARLITRLLADQSMYQTVLDMYTTPQEVQDNTQLASTITRPEWLCYQTGIELVHMNTHVLLVREITEETTDLPCDYRRCSLLLQQEGQWSPIKNLNQLSILEVLLPNHTLDMKVTDRTSTATDVNADPTTHHVPCSLKSATKLLATVINCIDNLLEDWYPDVGSRFAQNIQGMYLITRIVPCVKCFIHQTELQTRVSSDDEECWSQVFIRNGLAAVVKSIKLDSETHLLPNEFPHDISPVAASEDNIMYCFTIEECMLATQQRQMLVCSKHRQISSPAAGDSELHIAPDVVFADLDDHQLISQSNITRNKYLGRGAFSSVFKGIYKSENRTEGVAIKVLEPIKPGNDANSGDVENYELNQKKWNQDPMRAACKSYILCRQECGIMFTLNHKYIVQLLGISLQPLSLILEVAPQGELYAKIKDYRKNCAKLPVHAIKKIILQTASALHYLHNHSIIHRDLKSDNVMVWNLPLPHNTDPTQPVDIKLADYGISRDVSIGGKGYAGTPGFVAPEVIQFMGEESYTSKVDCFSFGMLIYELVTLHRPLEDQLSNAANWKSIILNSDRPNLRKRDTDLYPTHFIDLMVTCWDQEPHHRPSAEEIIAIASTPEFCHLHKAVSPDMCQNLRCATSIRTPDRPDNAGMMVFGLDELIRQTDVWLSSFHIRAMLEVVTYEDNEPIQTKCVKLKQTSSIMVMTPIDDYMWCGDERGYIIVICQKTYHEKLSVNISESVGVKVTNIVYFEQFNKVLVILDNGRIKVCDNSPDSVEDLNIKEYYGNGKKIYCATGVKPNNFDEVWCGQEEGAVVIWDFNHLDKQPQVEHHHEAFNNEQNTHFLVTSATDKKSLWSYVYPGTNVFLWDTEQKKVKRSLDCSRVVPYADRYQKQIIQHGKILPVKSQITAMNVIDNELYIGTTWGCVIVVDKNTMHHITSFRCHEQDDIYVKAILPLTFEDSSGGIDPRFAAPMHEEDVAKNIVTIGKGYRNVLKALSSATATSIRRHSLQNRTFLLSFAADNWKYY